MSGTQIEEWRRRGVPVLTWGELAQRVVSGIVAVSLGIAAYVGTQVYERIDELRLSVNSLQTRVEILTPAEVRFRELEGRLGKLETRVSVIEARLLSVEAVPNPP